MSASKDYGRLIERGNLIAEAPTSKANMNWWVESENVKDLLLCNKTNETVCKMASTSLVQTLCNERRFTMEWVISFIHSLLASPIYYVDQRTVVSQQRPLFDTLKL